MPTTTPGAPDFFTIEEAARILRIGRTAAYELAQKWRATEGRDGLPVVAFGRLLRVPRTALEALGGGPLATACTVTAEKPKPKPARSSRLPPRPSRYRSHAPPGRTDVQPTTRARDRRPAARPRSPSPDRPCKFRSLPTLPFDLTHLHLACW